MLSSNTFQEIENIVSYNDTMNVTETVGSYLNNPEYATGFREFLNGDHNRRSYLYEAISAVSQDVGDTLYKNINNYVDFVSNVETCKTRSLFSMMKMVGMNSEFIRNIFDSFPVEITKLIDILSIDRSILLKSGKIKDLLFLAMAREDVNCLSVIDDNIILNDDGYKVFVERVFHEYLIKRLTQTFDVESKSCCEPNCDCGCQPYQMISSVPVYSTFGSLYFQNGIDTYKEFNDQIKELKNKYAISKSFDEKLIVDDIDNGDDDLENYSGYELSVLNIEIKKRKSQIDVKLINSFKNVDLTSKLTTRYSYYKKMDVLGYVKFIENMFDTQISGQIYDFDPNYIWVKNESKRNLISSEIFDGEKYPFDYTMIDEVSRKLGIIVECIMKLRQRVKIHTQKIYMKGTNLLLVYIINEFLRDYGQNNLRQMSEEEKNDPKISAYVKILKNLSEHTFVEALPDGHLSSYDSYNIGIDEYYDDTEYFNIITNESKNSGYGNTVNPRFWEDTGSDAVSMNNDGKCFTKQEIEKMYLSSLGMRSSMDEVEFHKFMSKIYSIGADDSIVWATKNISGDNIFSTLIDKNTYVRDVYWRYMNLIKAEGVVEGWIDRLEWSTPTGMEGDFVEASSQMSNLINDFVYPYITDSNMSSICSLYNENVGQIDDLQAEYDELLGNVLTILSGDYDYYFKKSESPYSYLNNSRLNSYKHDYFIDNPDRSIEFLNLYQKMQEIGKYLTRNNIKYYPVLDSIQFIDDENQKIKDELESINQTLTDEFNFHNIQKPTNEKSINQSYEFTNKKLDARREFLKTQYDNLVSDVQTIKSEWDSMINTFNAGFQSYATWFSQLQSGYDIRNTMTVYCVSLQKYNKKKYPGMDNAGYVGLADRKTKSKPSGKPWVYRYNIGPKIVKHSKYTMSYDSAYYYEKSIGFPPSNKKTSYYPFREIKLENEWNDYDPVEKKCRRLEEFMSTPTTDQWNTEESSDDDSGESTDLQQSNYGFMEEGFFSIVQSTTLQIASIRKKYETYKTTAFEVFGFTVPDTLTTDEDKIDSLLNTLRGIEDFDFNFDFKVKRLSDIVQTLDDLKVSNEKIIALFDDMKTDPMFITITGVDVTLFEDLSQDNIERIRQDVQVFDTQNLEIIRGILSGYQSTDFEKLKKDIFEVEKKFINLGLRSYINSGNLVEKYIQDLYSNLQKNVDDKRVSAEIIIIEQKTEFDDSMNIISSELSDDYNNTEQEFMNLAGIVEDDLNPFNKELYQNYSGVLMTYGGMDMCYDPFYNVKNQVHPSYQIHPYVWNFIKKTNQVGLVNQGFMSNTVEKLIEGRSISDISEYIGEFGQTSATWKHYGEGLVDFSGYVSRYERGGNRVQSSQSINEVIDYEGMFYPPAVKMFLQDPEQSIISLSKRSGEFYDRFFKYLQLNDFDLNLECKRLTEYESEIRKMYFGNPDSYFDIFKYAVDINDDHFILVKEYDKNPDRLSFKEKLNVSGEMWIRISNHPIAFPAFGGVHSIYRIGGVNKNPNDAIIQSALNHGIQKYESQDQETGNYPFLIDNPRIFFDFDLNHNGNGVSYVVNMFGGNEIQNGIFNLIDFGVIISNPSINMFEFTNQILDFTKSKSDVDYIDFQDNSLVDSVLKTSFENLDVTTEFEYPKYIGTVITDTNVLSFVYLMTSYKYDETTKSFEKNIMRDGNIEYFIVNVQNGSVVVKTNRMIKKIGFDLDAYNACVTFNQNTRLLRMVLMTTEISGNLTYHENGGNGIDRYSGSDVRQPFTKNGIVSNSNDQFIQDIIAVDTLVVTGGQSINSENEIKIFNMNADLSYIPILPGTDSIKDVNDIKSHQENMYSFQLMGESKNVSEYEKNVKLAKDPFINYEEYFKSLQFGRIYEDGDSMDNSIKEMFVPPMYAGMPSFDPDIGADICTQRSDSYGDMIMELNVAKLFGGRMPENSIKNTKILIFNVWTSGKNPYFRGKLSDLVNKVVDLDYNDSSIGYEQSQNGVLVAGTKSKEEDKFIQESNRIIGVKSIQAQFNPNSRTLTLKFKRDGEIDGFVFVPNGTIKIVMFNTHDNSIINGMHMVDPEGYVQCKSIWKQRVKEESEDIITENWSIKWTRVLNNELSDFRTSYCIDDFGIGHMLSDLNPESYDDLSKLFIFKDNTRLAFKIDEDERFDDTASENYYYPTLNNKFPMNAASFVDEDTILGSGGKIGSRIFSNINEFVFRVDNSREILSNLGLIDIEYVNSRVGDLRVFENYSDDYYKFDPRDPKMMGYLHFVENRSSDNFEIDTGMTEGVYIDDTIESIREKYGINVLPRISQEQYDENQPKNFVTVNSNVLNPDDVEKLLGIHVNYDINENGKIVLFFNYINLIDSPYVELFDGYKVRTAIIGGTYLRVNPGEDGVLDIVAQVRKYDNGMLVGVRNIVLVSYRVFNVSDDKPKFILKRLYTAMGDQRLHNVNENDINVVVNDAFIDDSVHDGDPIDIDINLESESRVKQGGELYITYPEKILDVVYGGTPGYMIDDDETGFGMIHVRMTRSSNRLTLRFKFKNIQNSDTQEIFNTIIENTEKIRIQHCELESVAEGDCKVSILRDGELKIYRTPDATVMTTGANDNEEIINCENDSESGIRIN